jgi:hypothetical protein
MRAGRRFLQTDAGQFAYNMAITIGLAVGSQGATGIPALIGAGIGGGSDVVSQLMHGGPFDLGQFGVAVSRGALMGSIGGLMPGYGGRKILTAAASELVGGRFHTLGYNMVTNRDWGQDLLDPTDMFIDMLGGAAGSMKRFRPGWRPPGCAGPNGITNPGQKPPGPAVNSSSKLPIRRLANFQPRGWGLTSPQPGAIARPRQAGYPRWKPASHQTRFGKHPGLLPRGFRP